MKFRQPTNSDCLRVCLSYLVWLVFKIKINYYFFPKINSFSELKQIDKHFYLNCSTTNHLKKRFKPCIAFLNHHAVVVISSNSFFSTIWDPLIGKKIILYSPIFTKNCHCFVNVKLKHGFCWPQQSLTKIQISCLYYLLLKIIHNSFISLFAFVLMKLIVVIVSQNSHYQWWLFIGICLFPLCWCAINYSLKSSFFALVKQYQQQFLFFNLDEYLKWCNVKVIKYSIFLFLFLILINSLLIFFISWILMIIFWKLLERLWVTFVFYQKKWQICPNNYHIFTFFWITITTLFFEINVSINFLFLENNYYNVMVFTFLSIELGMITFYFWNYAKTYYQITNIANNND